MLEVDPWKDNFFFDLPSPFPPFPCVSSDQIAAQGDGGVDYERGGGDNSSDNGRLCSTVNPKHQATFT